MTDDVATSADAAEGAAGDPEATRQDVDEAFRAIMEGLRTTLPGTQALFGFLLIVPFQRSFESFGTLDRAAFYTAFIAAALATVLLIAPSAHQRMRAPLSGVKRRSQTHLTITVWVTILGTVVFAISLTAAVFLVSRIVFDNTTAAAATAGIVLTAAYTWFYLPVVTFERVE